VRTSHGIEPVSRTGAPPVNSIYVCLALGGSILGRHMNFSTRVNEARSLAKTGLITAMIDLSDGLSRDLHQICQQSLVGALIDSDAIPIHEDAIEMRRDGHAPLEHALHDGEDYELLFTASRPEPRLGTSIGVITSEPGIFLVKDRTRVPLEPKGWEHFF